MLAIWSFNANQIQITSCYLKSLGTDVRCPACHALMLMIKGLTEDSIVFDVYHVVFVTLAELISLNNLTISLAAYCA